MSDLTTEERVRRVKAALAEAGYPPIKVWFDPDLLSGCVRVRWANGRPPDEIIWRAFVIGSPQDTACWPCWSTLDDSDGCTHDPLTSPWPEVVR